MGIGRRLYRRMPDGVTSRIDMMRGFVSGSDLAGQIDKLRVLLRFRREHDELREALTYYRYVFGLMVAYRAGLIDALTDEFQSTGDLAEGRMTPRAAEMLLRILEAQGHVERDRAINGAGLRWRRSEFARHFLASDGELSYAALFELLTTFGLTLDGIVDGLQTGEVPPSLDVFEEAAQVDAFLDAVNAYLDNAGRELLAKIELGPVHSFICGSMGVSFSALLLDAHATARVTYGCLDHLVKRIPRLRARYRIDPVRVDGMHSHGGEPAADRWGSEQFDLVFLTKKMVLEPDQQLGEKFARKSYDVLNPGGTVILWEAVHHDNEPTPMALAMESVLDLAVSPTGCVLTRGSLTSLLLEIGFREVEFVTCLGGETSFVIARK